MTAPWSSSWRVTGKRDRIDSCADLNFCNQRAVEYVAANLINNALRAKPMGVALVRVGDDATVEVVDHGVQRRQAAFLTGNVWCHVMILDPCMRGARSRLY
jgi:hypothetical protein